MIVSRNPATGEVLGEVREASAAEIRDAVSRARGAQAEWGALPVKDRCARVARFRDLVVARAEELCALISAETGKTRSEALSMEVMVIADLATYFIKRAPRILAPEPVSLHLLKNRGSYLHFAPRGVVGIISPWNFPFGIATGEMVMS
ncbi:MAG TPA: aldehyde dehydrogenase family protein, partial [Polyangia bacterium]